MIENNADLKIYTKLSKAEESKKRLAEVALKLFASKGFDKTTMRDLAKEAGVSLGHFYYHFKSKEDIVNVFYLETLSELEKASEELTSQTKKFEDRYIGFIKARLRTFDRQRSLVIAISGVAVDPKSPLSPFGPETREIRQRTIGLIDSLIKDSDFKCGTKLEPYIARLLWYYLMGIIFFWVFDKSKNTEKTDELVKRLTPLTLKLIRASRLPLAGTVLKPVIEILKDFIPEEDLKL